MDNSILSKIRQLNNLLRQSSIARVPFRDLCSYLSEILESNIYLFFPSGKIFGYALSAQFDCPHTTKSLESSIIPDQFNEILHTMDGAVFNIHECPPLCTCKGVGQCIFAERCYTLLPVFIDNKKEAGMLLIRYGAPFDEAEEVLCDYASLVIASELTRRRQEQIERKAKDTVMAQIAVRSLSFTESKIAHALLTELNGEDQVIVLKTFADKLFVTRSIISSTLRKLESAGAIKTNSMGVKGTYIHLVNHALLDALEQTHSFGKDSLNGF